MGDNDDSNKPKGGNYSQLPLRGGVNYEQLPPDDKSNEIVYGQLPPDKTVNYSNLPGVDSPSPNSAKSASNDPNELVEKAMAAATEATEARVRAEVALLYAHDHKLGQDVINKIKDNIASAKNAENSAIESAKRAENDVNSQPDFVAVELKLATDWVSVAKMAAELAEQTIKNAEMALNAKNEIDPENYQTQYQTLDGLSTTQDSASSTLDLTPGERAMHEAELAAKKSSQNNKKPAKRDKPAAAMNDSTSGGWTMIDERRHTTPPPAQMFPPDPEERGSTPRPPEPRQPAQRNETENQLSYKSFELLLKKHKTFVARAHLIAGKLLAEHAHQNQNNDAASSSLTEKAREFAQQLDQAIEKLNNSPNANRFESIQKDFAAASNKLHESLDLANRSRPNAVANHFQESNNIQIPNNQSTQQLLQSLANEHVSPSNITKLHDTQLVSATGKARNDTAITYKDTVGSLKYVGVISQQTMHDGKSNLVLQTVSNTPNLPRNSKSVPNDAYLAKALKLVEAYINNHPDTKPKTIRMQISGSTNNLEEQKAIQLAALFLSHKLDKDIAVHCTNNFVPAKQVKGALKKFEERLQKSDLLKKEVPHLRFTAKLEKKIEKVERREKDIQEFENRPRPGRR